MKRILIFLVVLTACASASLSTDGSASLSNEQIDKIFISFEQQAKEEIEKERAEAKKKKEEEKLLKQMRGSSTNARKTSSFSRQILSHDGKAIVAEGKQMGMTPPPPSFTGVDKMAQQNFNVLGIICEHKKCIALTTNGNYKKGDVLPNGAKIKWITKTSIKTTQKDIDF